MAKRVQSASNPTTVVGFHPGLLSAQYALQRNWFPDPIQVKSIHVNNKDDVKIYQWHNQDHCQNLLASQSKPFIYKFWQCGRDSSRTNLGTGWMDSGKTELSLSLWQMLCTTSTTPGKHDLGWIR